ncbi:ATP synthase F(0) complex subunit B1, mitochondrial [Manis javanica]|nr:ATP synthase F(0) complex subunit B1, mitochondrial [Manis javanica]
MLSRVVLSAAATFAPSLKNAALLGPGALQAARIFHTGQPNLAPVPPLPEYGEVKQASIKQLQDVIDLEKSQQALVQKRHYLFDVQRNNIALALEVTYRKRLHRVYEIVSFRAKTISFSSSTMVSTMYPSDKQKTRAKEERTEEQGIDDHKKGFHLKQTTRGTLKSLFQDNYKILQPR